MVILLDIVQSWLKWLLYSPARFALIMLGVVVVIVGAVAVNKTDGEEPQPETASSAEAESASSAAPSGDTTPSPSSTDAPLTPDETADAKTLALNFVKAWSAKPDSAEKWLTKVEPYCSDELKSRMQWVDPRQSEKHTVDAKAPVRKADPMDDGSNTFGVSTDKGLVYVEVVKDETGTLKANNVYTGVGGE